MQYALSGEKMALDLCAIICNSIASVYLHLKATPFHLDFPSCAESEWNLFWTWWVRVNAKESIAEKSLLFSAQIFDNGHIDHLVCSFRHNCEFCFWSLLPTERTLSCGRLDQIQFRNRPWNCGSCVNPEKITGSIKWNIEEAAPNIQYPTTSSSSLSNR